MIDFNALKAPFDPHKVSWRVGSVTKDGSKALAFAYVDARDVMERLDDVCGPAGWQCKYSHANGKTVCDIGIKVMSQDANYDANGMFVDEWIWKADGAGDSDIEAEKGALSDAFKRAAVRWGIGRYLYDMKTPWVSIDQYKKIAPNELERLASMLPNAHAGVKQTAPAGLSKTPAKFWDRPILVLEVPDKFANEPQAVKNKWLIDNFMSGVNKAPNLDALARFQNDNSSWIDAFPSETTFMLHEACAVRAEQFKEYA